MCVHTRMYLLDKIRIWRSLMAPVKSHRAQLEATRKEIRMEKRRCCRIKKSLLEPKL